MRGLRLVWLLGFMRVGEGGLRGVEEGVSECMND